MEYVTEHARTATKPGTRRTSEGAIAQLGERLLCKQEVGGSIPPGSTSSDRCILGACSPEPLGSGECVHAGIQCRVCCLKNRESLANIGMLY
jgi:hypothetical protein